MSYRVMMLSVAFLSAAASSYAQQPSLAEQPGPLMIQSENGPSWDNAAETALHPAFNRRSVRAGRPSLLVPMYVGFAGLQIYDYALTMKGIAAGGHLREGNPIAAPAANNGLTLMALKAGTTASTVFLTERLWKRHPRRAVAVMSTINAAMALVVAHNQRVLR